MKKRSFFVNFRYFRKTSPSVDLTGKDSKNECISIASRLFIFWPIGKFVLKKKLDRNFQISDFEKSKNRKFWKSKNFRRISIEIFRKSKIRKFQNSKIRKFSIEILRNFFDFQNFRFFDFSKIFQLRRFFTTRIYSTFPLNIFLNLSNFSGKDEKLN